jgi:hypothetical protein
MASLDGLWPLAAVVGLLVFRLLFSPARIASWLHPGRATRPTRTWRDWTLSERLLVAAAFGLLLSFNVYRSYHSGGAAGIAMFGGVVAVILAIKGLTARARAR